MIAASTQGSTGIIGIAPKAELSLIKVLDDNEVMKGSYVCEGISFVLEHTETDIVNLSLSLSKRDFSRIKNDFHDLMRRCAEKRILVITSAGGNGSIVSEVPEIQAPSCEQYCISVGAIDAEFLGTNEGLSLHSKVNYVCPNFRLVSCAAQKDDYASIWNSSMAAGMLTGVSALAMSATAVSTDRESLLQTLNGVLNQFNPKTSLNILEVFRI